MSVLSAGSAAAAASPSRCSSSAIGKLWCALNRNGFSVAKKRNSALRAVQRMANWAWLVNANMACSAGAGEYRL